MFKQCCVLLLFLCPFQLSAGTAGFISYLEGDTYINRDQRLQSGAVISISEKESLKTDRNASLMVSFRNGSQLILFENTSLDLNLASDNNRIDVHHGNIWFLIAKESPTFQIQLSKVIVSSKQAALRCQLNRDTKKGFVRIDTGTAAITDRSASSHYSAGNAISFENDLIDAVSSESEQVSIISNLSTYYLPKSGQIPVTLRASLPSELPSGKSVSAYLVSVSPNITVESPVVDFYQEEIEFKALALGAGKSLLYVVTAPIGTKTGFEGAIPITVAPMRDTKIMKIKTARGTIRVKLTPKQE